MSLKTLFDISGKVAVITGGASGIGLYHAKELLRNGLRGVTLADVNPELGNKSLNEIKKEFGPDKAIFVQADVTNHKSFKDAFEQTISKYRNVDILVNNAGIMNDAVWEKEIAINLNGVIHGMLLGLDHYLPKHKTDAEGVIVNISSIVGVKGVPSFPIYSATKFGVVGLTKSWGDDAHYQRTKVRVLGLCPGVTDTPLISEMSKRNLGLAYDEMATKGIDGILRQKPENVAQALVKIVREGANGSVWVSEGEKDPYEFIIPERETFAPK